jgi:hypothetical protein
MRRHLLDLAAAILARLGFLRRPLPRTASSMPALAFAPHSAVGYSPDLSLGLPGRYALPQTGGEP